VDNKYIFLSRVSFRRRGDTKCMFPSRVSFRRRGTINICFSPGVSFRRREEAQKNTGSYRRLVGFGRACAHPSF
jgi:hypothetical protein